MVLTKKLKKDLYRIIIGIALFIMALWMQSLTIPTLWKVAAFVAAYLVVGLDVIIRAGKNILALQMLDENFLMMIATVGAFFVGEYPEAVAVMVFYQVGEFFQKYAVSKARKSIKDLMEICPEEARVLRDGKEVITEPDEVQIGEVLRILPGEKIPLDGVVIQGSSEVDTKALTGESMPQSVSVGMEVISGCINLSGVIEVEVKKEFGESTVTKILELVENASSKKASTERFITRFAKWYTPVVVAAAVLMAIVPVVWQCFVVKTAVFGWEIAEVFLYRALTFLVISCPCALVISVPLSFFGGIGGAGKKGILMKGSNYLENLVQAEYVVLDKTGTLTKGNFEITKVVALDDKMSEEELIGKLAALESFSNHPISGAVLRKKNAMEKPLSYPATDMKEIAGYGISGRIDGELLFAGNEKLLKQNGTEVPKTQNYGTVVYLANQKECLGYCLLEDEVKEGVKQALQELKKSGVKQIVMLTGDREETAQKIAEELEIDRFFAKLLPQDKVAKVEELFEEKSEAGKLVFVGDGINDAPVLARADIGIAMGGLGSDAAIEAADIVIMDDSISKISLAMKIAKKTVTIVKENIVFALGVKFGVLLLAAFGIANMWLAIFADVGVAMLAILNAMRALKA